LHNDLQLPVGKFGNLWKDNLSLIKRHPIGLRKLLHTIFETKLKPLDEEAHPLQLTEKPFAHRGFFCSLLKLLIKDADDLDLWRVFRPIYTELFLPKPARLPSSPPSTGVMRRHLTHLVLLVMVFALELAFHWNPPRCSKTAAAESSLKQGLMSELLHVWGQGSILVQRYHSESEIKGGDFGERLSRGHLRDGRRTHVRAAGTVRAASVVVSGGAVG
jgi:hypothetical protein